MRESRRDAFHHLVDYETRSPTHQVRCHPIIYSRVIFSLFFLRKQTRNEKELFSRTHSSCFLIFRLGCVCVSEWESFKESDCASVCVSRMKFGAETRPTKCENTASIARILFFPPSFFKFVSSFGCNRSAQRVSFPHFKILFFLFCFSNDFFSRQKSCPIIILWHIDRWFFFLWVVGIDFWIPVL